MAKNVKGPEIKQQQQQAAVIINEASEHFAQATKFLTHIKFTTSRISNLMTFVAPTDNVLHHCHKDDTALASPLEGRKHAATE